MNRLPSNPMSNLFWASVEARPVFGTLFLPSSSSVSVPWGLLKFCRTRNRVTISSNRKSIGCLVSKTKSPPTDAASSSPSTPESSSPPPPPTGLSGIDIISTSEHSDGSVVFRFGDASEMEKISVQLDEDEVTSVSSSEVASESLSSEDDETVAVLGRLQEDQQEPELRADSVMEVASEILLEDAKGVVVLEEAVSSMEQLEEKAGSRFVVELPAAPPQRVDDDSIARGPGDHHVLSESPKLRKSSEQTQLGLHTSDSFGSEVSLDKVSATVTEPQLDDSTNLEDSGAVGNEFDSSSIPFQNTTAASLIEEASDLEESPQAKAPDEDDSPAPSDPDEAITLEEESLEETSERDDEAVNSIELLQENAIDDDVEALKEEEESPVKTEDEDSTTAFSGIVTASGEELTEENIELELPELPTISAADEPKVDTSIVNSTSEDAEEDASPASALVEAVPSDDKEEEESPIKAEEEYSTTAFSGTVTASDEGLTEGNIELELPDIPTISAADEPKVDTSTVDITSEDTEEAAPSPASALAEAVSSDEAVGESVTPEEAVERGKKSDITEILDINTDESRSDKSTSRREEIVMSEFCLSSGAASLPHPSKALAGGEDAYFVGDKIWFGVADGAGHWSMEGTNTGLYAKELMEKCKATASSPVNHPRDVLVRSTAETQATGSSTALVAHFEDQVLLAASIGDSGFIIIRNGVVIERSRPTVHEFNFPVQIESGDDPSEHAECYRIELDEDDVIVAATDGLFDNLYEQEIASIVFKSLQASLSPQAIAEVLAARAQEVGSCTSARSPFSDAAQAAGYVGFTGGKLDDVTVIVSVVQKSSSSQQVMK